MDWHTWDVIIRDGWEGWGVCHGNTGQSIHDRDRDRWVRRQPNAPASFPLRRGQDVTGNIWATQHC